MRFFRKKALNGRLYDEDVNIETNFRPATKPVSPKPVSPKPVSPKPAASAPSPTGLSSPTSAKVGSSPTSTKAGGSPNFHGNLPIKVGKVLELGHGRTDIPVGSILQPGAKVAAGVVVSGAAVVPATATQGQIIAEENLPDDDQRRKKKKKDKKEKKIKEKEGDWQNWGQSADAAAGWTGREGWPPSTADSSPLMDAPKPVMENGPRWNATSGGSPGITSPMSSPAAVDAEKGLNQGGFGTFGQEESNVVKKKSSRKKSPKSQEEKEKKSKKKSLKDKESIICFPADSPKSFASCSPCQPNASQMYMRSPLTETNVNRARPSPVAAHSPIPTAAKNGVADDVLSWALPGGSPVVSPAMSPGVSPGVSPAVSPGSSHASGSKPILGFARETAMRKRLGGPGMNPFGNPSPQPANVDCSGNSMTNPFAAEFAGIVQQSKPAHRPVDLSWARGGANNKTALEGSSVSSQAQASHAHSDAFHSVPSGMVAASPNSALACQLFASVPGATAAGSPALQSPSVVNSSPGSLPAVAHDELLRTLVGEVRQLKQQMAAATASSRAGSGSSHGNSPLHSGPQPLAVNDPIGSPDDWPSSNQTEQQKPGLPLERRNRLISSAPQIAWPDPADSQQPNQSRTSSWDQLTTGSAWPDPNFGSSAWPDSFPQAQSHTNFGNRAQNPEDELSPMSPHQGWTVSAERLAKYKAAFQHADLDGDGFVDNEEARMMMERSTLSPPELSQIWELADVDFDGKLSFEEFVGAMHLVRRCGMEGVPVPDEMPEELRRSANITQATDPVSSPKSSNQQSCAPGFPSPTRASRPIGLPTLFEGAAMPEVPALDTWELSGAELARIHSEFVRLGGNRSGSIGPEEGRILMEQSQLPVAELAHIWTISDVDGDGRLAPNEFVCAMALTARRRAGTAMPNVAPEVLLQNPPPGWPSVAQASKVPVRGRERLVSNDRSQQPLRLGQDDAERYAVIFRSEAQNGPGASFAGLPETKIIMEKSGLPTEDLAHIYQLSDGDRDGRLSLPEFLCAMALIAHRLGGQPLPDKLPEDFVQQCCDAATTVNRRSSSMDTLVPTPEELDCYKDILTSMGLYGSGAPVGAQDGVQDLLEQSGLPTSDLAQIWQLSDVDRDGLLSPGELMCAMVLTGCRRRGVELPSELQPELLELARTQDF